MSQTTETQVSINQDQLNRLLQVAKEVQKISDPKITQIFESLQSNIDAHRDIQKQEKAPLDSKIQQELITALGYKAEEILTR
jgi:hypothetical protein